MTDWAHVAFNALWIAGCAVILAAFSHAHWLAHLRGLRARQLLSAPAFQLPFSVGLSLVSLGLFLLGRGWLEHGVWAFFAVVFAWQSWSLWRSSPR
jgi:hypothetical protein